MIEWSWMVLAVVPLAILLQNLLHELSHVFVGMRREGREPKELVIWPHRFNDKWYWARTLHGPPRRRDPSRLMHLAPVWQSLFVCLVTGILFLILPPAQKIFVLPSFGAAAATIIYFWWCYFFTKNPYTDGYRYRHGENNNALS